MASTGASTPAQDSSASASVSDKPVPLKEPLAAPTPSSVPPPRPPLTDAEAAKYAALLAEVKTWVDTGLGEAAADATGPATTLLDSERQWLTRECLLRYLRATKWHVAEAAKRLRGTLAWRRAYGVDGLTAEHIGPENETGKQLLLGFDREGRVCHYLLPGRQNTDASPRQVQHLVYMVERVADLLPPGQEALALLINFQQTKSRRGNTAPGLGLAREVLHILQTHYPERLGRALIINVPWVVWGFFKLITPFIDPHTREKLKFNEDLTRYVPPEQLWTEFHGDLVFEYDHAVYWPALTRLAAERRAQRTARWEAGGKHIGELEDYLYGGRATGVAGEADGQDETGEAAETKAAEKQEEAGVEKQEAGVEKQEAGVATLAAAKQEEALGDAQATA